MSYPTLDEFIKKGNEGKLWPFNAYVTEPGFKSLYVRWAMRGVNGKVYQPTLDIANLEARVKGQGTFKAFVARLRREHPELSLFVENVLEEKFRGGLDRLGFQKVMIGLSECYFMGPVSELTELAKHLDIWDQTVGCDRCSSAWWMENAIGEPRQMLWHEKTCPLYERADVFQFWNDSYEPDKKE